MRCAGEDTQQSVNLLDMHRRIQWGNQKGLHLMYVMQLHVLKRQLKGQHKQAAAQNVRNLKALHQVALDGGEWKTGWELTFLPHPLQRQRFGGTAAELEAIGAMQVALDNIEKAGGKTYQNENKSWWEKQKEKKEAAGAAKET